MATRVSRGKAMSLMDTNLWVGSYPSFVTLVRVKYLHSCDSIHPEHKR